MAEAGSDSRNKKREGGGGSDRVGPHAREREEGKREEDRD